MTNATEKTMALRAIIPDAAADRYAWVELIERLIVYEETYVCSILGSAKAHTMLAAT